MKNIWIRFENKTIAKRIISLFEKKLKFSCKKSKLIRVKDRLGHDKEYKINCSKIKELGWNSKTNFDKDLLKTINFYKT